MRRNYVPNSIYHIILRGSRGMDIFYDESDFWDCLRYLFVLNDEHQPRDMYRDLSAPTESLFSRPSHWPERKPLISIMAFCIHSNHLHLLVKQSEESAISAFMRRLPKHLTKRFNNKYDGKGSVFQGPYKSRRIYSDADLQNVALYIMIKNVFERAPGGLKRAEKNFEKTWTWALSDDFSSFPDYASTRQSPIVERGLLNGFFSTPAEFKKKAKDYTKWRKEREELLGDLALE